MSLSLTVSNLPDNIDLQTSNLMCLSRSTIQLLKSNGFCNNYLKIGAYIFKYSENNEIKDGFCAMNSIHRELLCLVVGNTVQVFNCVNKKNIALSVDMQIDVKLKVNKLVTFEYQNITDKCHEVLTNQYITYGQEIVIRVNDINVFLKITQCELLDDSIPHGLISYDTVIKITTYNPFIIVKGDNGVHEILKQNFDINNIGIGGLDDEFIKIFRRAFASRIFPQHVIKNLGIQHVKGVLLHGPPGTGKTLIARQLSKFLNGREPKIVNGPEVLSRYVGESAANIRKLFEDAEKYPNEFHVIIFDEIDSICKSRSSQNNLKNDDVVNQLLSKIDGVNSLNNILIIGMTNRKDLLDEALLRPGRLEVHIEIPLPDEKGRLQILKIHTQKMNDSGYLHPLVKLDYLAKKTKNYSGAEIEAIVKSASSFALSKKIDVSTGIKISKSDIIIQQSDFENALQEIKPSFGRDDINLEKYLSNGIIYFNNYIKQILDKSRTICNKLVQSNRVSLASFLLYGEIGSGKSALASQIAIQSEFAFIKIITPDDYPGLTDIEKCNSILKIFEDAYKSDQSCIIIDDIEKLINYVSLNNYFSVVVLQTLLVLLNKQPPLNKKLLIIGTTSNLSVIQDLDLISKFDEFDEVPQVKPSEVETVLQHFSYKNILEIKNPIGIKKLIYKIELL